jgi:pyroglutamyl-peptidase
MMQALPRVLVTGFSVFPGAPVNPTEALIAALDARRADLSRRFQLTTEVFAVDYRALPGRLASLAEAGCPDIAIHFGLSTKARGFVLERVARNETVRGKPDNSGHAPEGQCILEAGQALATSLPLELIHAALAAKSLPVDYSDDAGGYLCNYLFYHSRAGRCGGFAPPMSGFVHVPPLVEQGGTMTLVQLVLGAETIVATCCEAWTAQVAARN